MKILRRWIVALAALALFPLALQAQGGTGTVQGTVRLEEAPLAGARVILGSSTDSSFRHVTTTDDQGSFTISAVPLGGVNVKIFAGGKLVVRGEGILEREGETITVFLEVEP